VLSTIEVAYAKAHEDAAGASRHAGFANEMLELTALLARLLPGEAEVHALAATIRFAEARRPARLSHNGEMIPLSEQDPAQWRQDLIAAAARHMEEVAKGPPRPRTLQAAIHQTWCQRRSLADPRLGPKSWRCTTGSCACATTWWCASTGWSLWRRWLGLQRRLAELEQLPNHRLADFLPYHALRADLLRRAGRPQEARVAYDAALALEPAEAEARWLGEQRASLR
jgi:RNA polymerase sigma-70 factor (ECF subfamily)